MAFWREIEQSNHGKQARIPALQRAGLGDHRTFMAEMSPNLPPNRIVIFRQSALGDVIMTQAVVDQISTQFPNAKIVWIASPGVMPLMAGMERKGLEIWPEQKPKGLTDRLNLASRLKSEGRTWLLCLQSTLRSNLTYPFIEAEKKFGWDNRRGKNLQGWVTNDRLDYRQEHLLDGFLSFLPKMGLEVAPPRWSFCHSEKALDQVEQWLGSGGESWLAVNPSASKPERNWPLESMARVITSLRADGVKVVLTGGPSSDEVRRAEALEELAKPDLNLCGKTDVSTLMTLLSKVNALLAPDTGPVHMARAVDTPVVGLYAVATARLTGPHGRLDYCVDRWEEAVRKFLGKDPAKLDWHHRVHHPDAMGLITVEEVLTQCHRALEVKAVS